MAKQKTKESQKEKEQVKANPKLSPSEVGLQQTPQVVQEAPAGEPASTVTTEEGTTVQVGQKDQSQQGTSEQTRDMHPLLGVAFETNVIKYKGRSTEFLTLGKKLTDQPLYPFKGGSKKQKARITLTEDGKRLIIEKVQE
jgi:hypothetical protein